MDPLSELLIIAQKLRDSTQGFLGTQFGEREADRQMQTTLEWMEKIGEGSALVALSAQNSMISGSEFISEMFKQDPTKPRRAVEDSIKIAEERLYCLLSEASDVPVETFRAVGQMRVRAHEAFIFISDGGLGDKETVGLVRKGLDNSKAIGLLRAECKSKVFDLVVSGKYYSALNTCMQEVISARMFTLDKFEILEHLDCKGTHTISALCPIDESRIDLPLEFFNQPQVQACAHSKPAVLRSFMRAWKDKVAHELQVITFGNNTNDFGNVHEVLAAATEAGDRSLLDLSSKLLTGDLALLELVLLVPSIDSKMPKLELLPLLEERLNSLKEAGIESQAMSLIAGTGSYYRAELLEALSTSSAARDFLLKGVSPRRSYGTVQILNEEKLQFLLSAGSERWNHTGAIFVDTVMARTAKFGQPDYEWITGVASVICGSEHSESLERLLLTKRFIVPIINTYLEISSPELQNIFLEIVEAGDATVKVEPIMRKLSEFDFESLRELRLSGADWIKRFWAYKKPSDKQADIPNVTPPIIKPHTIITADSTPTLKGSYWLDSFKEKNADVVDDLNVILSIIPEDAHSKLRTIFRNHSTAIAMLIADELGTLYDINPALGRALLGSTKDVENFCAFILKNDFDTISKFQTGQGNLRAWMNSFFYPSAAPSIERSLAIPEIFQGDGLESVDTVQIVSRVIGKSLSDKHTKAKDDNSVDPISLYNPNTGVGSLSPDGKGVLVLIDRESIAITDELGYKHARVGVIEEASLEQISLIIDVARQKFQHTQQMVDLETHIRIPISLAADLRDIWRRYDERHQSSLAGYLGRVASNGTCGTIKRLQYRATECLEVRLLTPSGPRAYLYRGKGDDASNYYLLRLGDKSSQNSDITFLNKNDVARIVDEPSGGFSSIGWKIRS